MTATLPSRTTERRSAQRPSDEPVPTDQDEAADAVEGGEPVGIPSVAGVLRGIGSAFAQPGPVTRGAGRLVRDWAAIVRGTETHRPAPKDKRFADPAWSDPTRSTAGWPRATWPSVASSTGSSTSTRRPRRTGTTSSGRASRWAC